MEYFSILAKKNMAGTFYELPGRITVTDQKILTKPITGI
jgi:hypothetical protein